MSIDEKLALLLKHWIEHNNSHKETYLSWAEKAVDGKLEETAKFLRQTAELSVRITENLENALESIKR
ncbi:MAG: hypothetical protein HQK61_05990 [Desulfamplus sp.]|nr:hypothetical protein [Desulfamplus sp.]